MCQDIIALFFLFTSIFFCVIIFNHIIIILEGDDLTEPYERIRQLRKNILDLTLEEFSTKINISRSNLGNIETGRIGLTERVLLDVCRTFRVRREWIETGNEPIFEDETDPLDIQISKLYATLTDENKKYLYGYIQRLIEEQKETQDILSD